MAPTQVPRIIIFKITSKKISGNQRFFFTIFTDDNIKINFMKKYFIFLPLFFFGMNAFCQQTNEEKIKMVQDKQKTEVEKKKMLEQKNEVEQKKILEQKNAISAPENKDKADEKKKPKSAVKKENADREKISPVLIETPNQK